MVDFNTQSQALSQQLSSRTNVVPIRNNETTSSSSTVSAFGSLNNLDTIFSLIQMIMQLLEQMGSGSGGSNTGNQTDNTGSTGSTGTQNPPNTASNEAIYEERFREAVTNNINQIGVGWDFSEGIDLVQIKNGTLQQPETRSYVDGQGNYGMETVIERNEYWEVVERDGRNHMVARQTDDQGQAIQPSAALNDVFNNPDKYSFDCSTPMALINMKATMDVIGEDDFNRNIGQLTFSGWKDSVDGDFDGGFNATSRTAGAGEVNVNGVANLAGETAMYDPQKDGPLEVGNAYYFELPGDRHSDQQGWNAVYMGTDQNGKHNFWSPSVGTVQVEFQDNSWVTKVGYENYYLGGVNASPNVSRLAAMDSDGSGLA